MKRNVWSIAIVLFVSLTVVFVEVTFATLIDIQPGTVASISGVRVESYVSFGPGDELVTDVTEQDWSKEDVEGWMDSSLNFYFTGLTNYIHLNVYTLGDTLVTNGGYFSFRTYDVNGMILNTAGLSIDFGEYIGVDFMTLYPLISRLEVRFSDIDAGGFVDTLSYNIATPEPSTVMMFGVGLVMLIGQVLRKKKPHLSYLEP